MDLDTAKLCGFFGSGSATATLIFGSTKLLQTHNKGSKTWKNQLCPLQSATLPFLADLRIFSEKDLLCTGCQEKDWMVHRKECSSKPWLLLLRQVKLIQAVSPQQRPYSAQVAALSSVPTGRLLDLVEHSPAGSSTSTLRQAHIPTTILELTAGEERPKSGERYGDVSRGGGGARPRDCWADTLARDGGGGGSNDRQRSSAEARRTERGIKSGVRNPAANNGEEEFIENWEFVFSDLQQRGYTKDQAERPDVLTAARQSRGNTETPSSSR